MATLLPIPPTETPLLDPRTGQISLIWQNYYLNFQAYVASIAAAPLDAQYWLSTANGTLTNERNIGLLATGYLKIVTALGIATPSTTTSIPAADIGSGDALTKTNDTNVTLTLGGTPTSALLKAVSLTLGWTGLLGLARGGTAADLSATGGASQVLRQSTAGGAVTVSQLTASDISGLTSGTTRLLKTSGYTVQTTDGGDVVVMCDASGGAFTITVPTAVANTQRITVLKTDSSANAVTVAPTGSETIGGESTLKLYAQQDVIAVFSDNVNWELTSESVTIVARAYRDTSAQTITTGSTTRIVFNATQEDTAAAFNTTTGVFTAPRAGRYSFSVMARWTTMTAGANVFMDSYLNGSQGQALSSIISAGDAMAFAGIARLATSQTLDFRVGQGTGSSQTIGFGSQATWVQIAYEGN